MRLQRKSRHWPFPVIKAPNKVMVCAAFVSVLERSDLEFVKGLECLEHPAFERAGQHSGENFAIGGRHTREEEIDLVLIGREFWRGVHVPDARPRAPRPDLPLTIVADIDKKIDYGSVFLRLHWLGHFVQSPMTADASSFDHETMSLQGSLSGLNPWVAVAPSIPAMLVID